MDDQDDNEASVIMCSVCKTRPAVVIVNVTVETLTVATYQSVLCANCYVDIYKNKPHVKLT